MNLTLSLTLRRFVAPALALAFPFAASAHDGSSPPFMGLDANDNYISDLYEALYPLTGGAHADDDGDGVNNEDEAAAGTSARSGAEFLNFSGVTNNGSVVTGSFRSAFGKRYQMQAQSTLGGTWTNEGSPIQGDGSVMQATAPSTGARMFVRLQVSDQDTDSDGLNDWEEGQAGTDRYMWDTDGDGTSDLSYVQGLMAASSNVSIYAVNAFTSEGSAGVFRVTRAGGFLPLTVPFAVSGTAGQGTDYNLSALNAMLPAGVTSATVTVTAIVDAPVEDAETVTLTLQGGAGYVVGTPAAATMTIVSQGIMGEYFNSSSGTYTFDPLTGANWDPLTLALSRRDAGIDFDWLSTPPAPVVNDDVWGARWQGFIIPRYSELYQVHAIADRGVKVYISAAPITAASGQIRIDQWSTTNPTTKYTANALANSAAFVAGQAYYIRVDYRDSATNTNNANIQIRWSSASQAEETIPASRFTSDNVTGTAAAITSPLFMTAISGAPFTYQIAATNTPTTFSASGLPGGLSVNGAGLISGTLSAAAGYHFMTISAGNTVGADAKLLVIFVATTGGGITRDVWNGLTGTGVQSVPLHTAPSATANITALETGENLGDGFGDRIRGYLTAPTSGFYSFFVTSDENAEVWISAGETAATKLKRSFISYGSVGTGVWNALTSQQSLPMLMKGGQRYFIEVIRRESTGTDHLQVGWLKPGQTGTPEVIPGWALSPDAPALSGSQSFVPPADPPPAELTLPGDATARKKEIVRFMQQATFGAAPDRDGAPDASPVNAPYGGWQADSIEAVQQLGYAGWLDAQMAMSAGVAPEILVTTTVPPTTVYQAPTNGRRTPNTNGTAGNGSGPMATYIRQYYERYPRSGPEPNGVLLESANEIWRAWWKLSSTAPDQLRHRVAFALSQILVLSEEGEFDERARWVSHYYDLLYYHGLENFRTLLEKVTLNPTMGGYLDMLNNEKANPATGYIPNENYAREIMQLFSIGLRRLHPDGTLVLDSGGLPVPTYLQDNVVGLASTLTGWRLASGAGNWILPMLVTQASRHDFTDKLLLEEAYIPASATQTIAQCDLELDQSHDLLFHHPNTGPFICRQLIQRMVTANPSPGYIYRVARVFADNGSGVRGDMKSVVKALLLDPEARNAAPRTQPGYGHVKEPVIRGTQFIRAFKGYSLAESLPEWANANDLGTAMFSPAVHVDLTLPLPQRTDRWPDPAGTANRTLTVALTDTPATGSVTISLSGTASAVLNGDYVRIDSEAFLVTAGGGTSTLTADRAQLETAAAAHAVGATVSRLRPYDDNYIDEMIDPDGTGPLLTAQFSLIVQPGNTILLRRQTTGSVGGTANGETISPENGLYTVVADTNNAGRYKLERAANADTGPKVTKAFVMAGTVRRDDGTLTSRTYYQERVVTTIGTDAQYWVNQGQTNTSKGTANFSPATNVNIAAGFASSTGTTRTATLTETISAVNYNMTISTNQVLLLRRQTANAGQINSDGNTSSPENGLYTVTNDPGNSARVTLVRTSNTNTAAEMLNASVSVTQMRMDDGSLYPPTTANTAEQPVRIFRQELAVVTLGTDPVRWSQQATGGGIAIGNITVGGAISVREAWGIGSTGSGTLGQTPLRSPTVFNFYEPDYVFLGHTGNAGLYGPEFQITSETSVVNSANWFVDLTRRNSTNATTNASPFSYGQGFSYGDPFKKDVKLDLTAERALATDSSAMLDHLGIMLMPNAMTPRLKTLVQGFLDAQTTAATDADRMNRLGEALYLISLSPEFITQQ